ncbi:FecR protein [Pedobacter steynii]|uniref:FecR protein n=1 Tax=Pedobacter steynii TaxID=430522 RepID=A0A1G9S743_9SPHI|nr:FecR family protein [Pedobacter steynii]NQX37526.1 FecR family protein [Pedobacter steynii]SDM31244.1 FecR protein [Pedobacter steynii]
MEYQKLLDLIEKYEKDLATTAEAAELDQWYDSFEQEDGYVAHMEEGERVVFSQRLFGQIDQQIEESLSRPVLKFRPVFRWLAAAMVFIIFGLGLYFYPDFREAGKVIYPSQYASKILPGGNKAILTLSDGSEISLTDAENGALTKQSGIKIIKTADGQLVYDARAAGSSSEASNTITTPRGGQYQVNLPDGTKVWLNAASSLKFPLTFTDQKNRIVELSGEAYFEVAKNKHQPFKVITAVRPDQEGREQIIEVLGTHFNVNAYPDEESIVTTLLEGSIRLNNKLILKPNQESIFAYDHFHVVSADTEEAVAWKNGYFMFANEDLRSIMRKISRWYNLEIVYQGKTTDNTFIGTVSRFKEVSEVLNILELTRTVHFKIEGRKITVMP